VYTFFLIFFNIKRFLDSVFSMLVWNFILEDKK